MAFHAYCFRTEVFGRGSRGEDDGCAVAVDPALIIGVADFALHRCPDRSRRIDDIRSRAVRAEEILEAGSAVAFRACRGDLLRIGIVPVVKSLGMFVGVAG